jgi:hypothetical protein
MRSTRSLALQALLAWQRATAATAELADAQGFSARWLVMVELAVVAVSVVTATTESQATRESPTPTLHRAPWAQQVRTVELVAMVDAVATRVSVETAEVGRSSASTRLVSRALQVTRA